MPRTLEDFLANAYDRTQRTQPQTPHRSVLRFEMFSSQALLGTTPPTHIACGIGSASGAIGTATPLVNEIERFPTRFVQNLAPVANVLRVSGDAKRQDAVGPWREAGLFVGDAITHTIDSCDRIGNWLSHQGALIVDVVSAREGDGCLQTSGQANSVPFTNLGGLTPAIGTPFAEVGSRLQMWYFIDNIARLSAAIPVRVRLGSSAFSFTTHYYEFSRTVASLTTGWNWLSWEVSGFSSKVGAPNINRIVTCAIFSTKVGTAVERIDKIRLFRHAGTTLGYIARSPAIEKQWGETKWVYWDLSY